MVKRCLVRPLALATLIVLTASSVLAQAPGAAGTQWSLGLGVISAPRPYIGADNETMVIPLVQVTGKRFYVRGITAGYHLAGREGLQLDLVAGLSFAGFEEDDAPFLAGMENRDPTLAAGLEIEWQVGAFAIELSGSADVLGRSDGIEAGLGVSRPQIFGHGRSGVIPGIALRWQDANAVDYAYGVRLDEVRSDRPFYAGSSALCPEASVRAFRRVGRRMTLNAFVVAQRLADEIVDSPIVDQRWTVLSLVGVSRSF